MSAASDIPGGDVPCARCAGAFDLLASRWTMATLIVFAIVQQCLGHHNTDNSWLMTVCEKILDGARPYVDIVETNPPASFLIYMPAVALARALGARAELVVSIFAFANIGLCVWLWARILGDAGLLAPTQRGLPILAAMFGLAVLPGMAFAEREHFALIWALPILAAYAARASGAAPRLPLAIAAGALAALVVAIKPHFALPLALAFAGALMAQRSIRLMFAPENLVAACVVALYGASLFVVFPAFFKILPSVLDAYVPIKQSTLILLKQPWLVMNAALLGAAAMIGGGQCLSPRAWPLMAASLGFAATYFWQGKGWMNHELPAVALTILAIAMLLAPMLGARGDFAAWKKARPIAIFAVLPAVLCAPLLFGAMNQWTNAEEHEGLTSAVRRHAPAHPRIIALSPQLTAGHPLTRRLDGVWVGRTHSALITVAARMLIAANRGDKAYRARLKGYVDAEAAGFLADVRAGAPDVILVDRDARVASAIADLPDFAAALTGYGPVATADDIEVWTPKQARQSNAENRAGAGNP